MARKTSNEACWDGFERWLAAASYYQELWDLPGKQKLWASEEYSTYSDSNGGRCLAKLVNRNYVDGNFTALIVWDMVWACKSSQVK